MKITRLPDPRPGQVVQCIQCHKMIDAKRALIDLEGEPYKAYYHPQCVDTNWELVEERGLYFLWKFEDFDGATVYNVTQKPEPPITRAGYYSYGYLLKVKGLLKGVTLNSIMKEINDNENRSNPEQD